jgi:hypothetical protein
MLWLNFLTIANNIRIFPIYTLFIFFTGLSAIATTITIYLTIKIARRYEYAIQKNYNLLSIYHLLFEISTLFNVLTTIIYWTVLHPKRHLKNFTYDEQMQ